MTYEDGSGGRIDIDASGVGRIDRSCDLLSFADVEERLVQAMLVYWRNGDRERGWLSVRSGWPDVLREASAGDYDARGGDRSSSDVAIRPASLTRLEVAEAEEALGWMDAIDPVDRRLVGLVLTARARGVAQVPWSRLLRPMGLTRGADGLRKRYERAIGRVCRGVNGGIAGAVTVKGVNLRD